MSNALTRAAMLLLVAAFPARKVEDEETTVDFTSSADSPSSANGSPSATSPPRSASPSSPSSLTASCFRRLWEDDMLSSSRWIINGGPSTCAGCGNPFPHKDRRIEAQVGRDGRLYCHDTTCEADALEARAIALARAS